MAWPDSPVVATRGAAHNQEFEVECVIGKFGIHVGGIGSSRRAAEQEAARKALVAVTDAMRNRNTSSSGKGKQASAENAKMADVPRKLDDDKTARSSTR